MNIKILYVSARFVPCMGGTELHTYEVARRFVSEGHQVNVLTTDVSGKLPAQETIAGINVIRTKVYFKNTDFYLSPNIYRKILDGNWDIIHCQGYHTFIAPIAMLGAIRARTPFILSFHSGGHSSNIRQWIRPLQIKLLKPLISRASAIIGTTEWEIQHFSNLLNLKNKKYHIVSNGSYLPKIKQNTFPNDSEINIVSIGRLEKYKGHHRIIEAFLHIIKRLPNAKLSIVGTGPYQGVLEGMITDLGLEDCVKIIAFGTDERAKLSDFVARAHLVTILSEYESQGMAALEALSLGRKVLVTESSALLELTQYDLVKAVPLNCGSDVLADSVVSHLFYNPQDKEIKLPTWNEGFQELKNIYAQVLNLNKEESNLDLENLSNND